MDKRIRALEKPHPDNSEITHYCLCDISSAGVLSLKWADVKGVKIVECKEVSTIEIPIETNVPSGASDISVEITNTRVIFHYTIVGDTEDVMDSNYRLLSSVDSAVEEYAQG